MCSTYSPFPLTFVTVQWTQWIVLLPLPRGDGVTKPDESWPWSGLWQLPHKATSGDGQPGLNAAVQNEEGVDALQQVNPCSTTA